MLRPAIIASLAVLAACKADREPAWALDPIYLEPAGEGVIGFQTWEVFSERWSKRHAGKHYLCAVVVEFNGTPGTCPDCTFAWDVQTSLVESDCPDRVTNDPLPLSLRAIGVGDLGKSEDAPYGTQSSLGWADYGFGWEVHGWAHPDALDNGGASSATDWDGAEPFALWPTAAWPL